MSEPHASATVSDRSESLRAEQRRCSLRRQAGAAHATSASVPYSSPSDSEPKAPSVGVT